MRIVKYRIESQAPEDETFEVTKETKVIVTTKLTQETDDCGNLISFRHPYPVHPPQNSIEETITAIGKQSKMPAKVVILETDEGPTKEFINEAEADRQRLQPVRIDHLMRSDVRKINPNDLFK